MVGLYDDPFAYDGAEFPAFLAQDSSQFASGSSPEDFHVHSATEPHFPSSVHAALKGHHQQHPAYLSPVDHPLGSPTAALDHHHGIPSAHHLPRSAPTSYPIPRSHQPLTRLDTMGLASWNTTNNNNQPAPPDPTTTAATTEELRALVATLQSDLRQAALERDEARMQLSTARNELYAARQTEKRLRVERDEARSQAEFLSGERVKLKQSEGRLRRERNEARMAVMALKGKGGSQGKGQGGRKGVVVGGGGGVESQGEESGESPPMGMEQG